MGTAPTCAGGWAGHGAGGSVRTARGRRGPAWQKAPRLFQPGTVLEPEGGLGEWPGGQTESCLLVRLHLAGSCLLRQGRWLRSGMRSHSQSRHKPGRPSRGLSPSCYVSSSSQSLQSAKLSCCWALTHSRGFGAAPVKRAPAPLPPASPGKQSLPSVGPHSTQLAGTCPVPRLPLAPSIFTPTFGGRDHSWWPLPLLWKGRQGAVGW